MTLGSYEKDGERCYRFELSESEFLSLMCGKNIYMVTGNTEYRKAKFTISFKGERRKFDEIL